MTKDEIEKVNQLNVSITENDTNNYLKIGGSLSIEEGNNLIEKKQIEAQQRVFNQSPEYKKREIVFGQIQRINSRLSDLEEKVDEIIGILKADR